MLSIVAVKLNCRVLPAYLVKISLSVIVAVNA